MEKEKICGENLDVTAICTNPTHPIGIGRSLTNSFVFLQEQRRWVHRSIIGKIPANSLWGIQTFKKQNADFE